MISFEYLGFFSLWFLNELVWIKKQKNVYDNEFLFFVNYCWNIIMGFWQIVADWFINILFSLIVVIITCYGWLPLCVTCVCEAKSRNQILVKSSLVWPMLQRRRRRRLFPCGYVTKAKNLIIVFYLFLDHGTGNFGFIVSSCSGIRMSSETEKKVFSW